MASFWVLFPLVLRCIVTSMALLTAADDHPAETVTLARRRDDGGEPTDRVEMEGFRQDDRRTRIVPYARLPRAGGHALGGHPWEGAR